MHNLCNCNYLNKKHVGENVEICGWIKTKRKLGKLLFIDLYDGYGITQIIFENFDNTDNAQFQLLKNLNLESVIKVKGKVNLRKTINPKLSTGEIEVLANSLEILNKSNVTPFVVSDKNLVVAEDLRLKYRFLDLRRESMQNILRFRSELSLYIRNYLCKDGFVEIETPIISNSSPEGARDFLVPSRIHKNQFYALPQSPQIYKQILMASGFDRYFQIAKCFRDEDMRSDRQPEFTQLDLELAFVDKDFIMQTIEGLLINIMNEFFGLKTINFAKMNYQDAINNYGSDKPDLRFDYKLHDISAIFAQTKFKIFQNKPSIKALFLDLEISTTQYNELVTVAKQNKFAQLGIMKFQNGQWDNSIIANHLSDEEKASLQKMANKILPNAKNAFTILLLAGNNYDVSMALGAIRNKIAQLFKLFNDKDFKFLWVVNFPLFLLNSDTNKWESMHHPFTLPTKDTQKFLDDDLSKVNAEAYDIVLNGYELGGGSLRIYSKELQLKIFKILNISEKQAQSNFQGLFRALEFGIPPHGGIALGMDRLIMILKNLETIRDTIAFPKNTNGNDLLMASPGPVSSEELENLAIKILK